MDTVDLFEDARRRRDRGVRRAGEHADRKEPSWKDRAARLIRDYALVKRRPFLVEDVRPFAMSRGLPPPPDGRAWGAAIRLARRLGYVESCGYAPSKSSNCSPKVLWRLVGG